MNFKIYHNPRCRKSREALLALESSGHDYEVVEYLKQPLTDAELRLLLAQLNLTPHQVIRTGEKLYKEKFKGMTFSTDEWIRVLTENPKLLERPIIVRGHKARIARTLEAVEEILG